MVSNVNGNLCEGDDEGEHLDNDVDDELLQWSRSCDVAVSLVTKCDIDDH